MFRAAETILQCPHDGAKFVSEQLRALAPDKCTFGFDVIVHVGRALFLRSLNEREVIKELAAKNIPISPREISYLGRKFITYLALAHRQSRESLRLAMTNRGGYILHLDGTCESDSPHLFCGLDGISELVLDSIKIPSESKKLLIPFLRRIKEQYGQPVALVHDMSSMIIQSVEEVFKGVPDFICHFHFLRDIGKDLLLADYQIIIKRLRKANIRPILREKAKYFEKVIENDSLLISRFKSSLEKEELMNKSLKLLPTATTYLLIQWAFQASRQSNGYGFPFDRTHLVFYLRLREIYHLLEKIMNIRLRNRINDNSPFFRIYRLLEKLFNDDKLNKAAKNLQERAQVFDKLREAMRIAMPEGKDGLNDDGDDIDMLTIEKNMIGFRQWLECDEGGKKTYDKTTKQIDKYWDKLFRGPISVSTDDGKKVLFPQRTNNLLERFFRKLKRGARRRCGTSSLTKTLKAILADTPLVRNLENDQYVEIILNGCDNLAQRFARIEERLVREQMKNAQNNRELIDPEVKKIVARPDLPKEISTLFLQHGNNHANPHLRS